MERIIPILQARRRFILLFTLGVAILSVLLALLQPLKYSASIRLLITQKAAFTLDPYTAIRATELIGEHLAQLVGTSSFLERVLQSGYQIDQNYFKLPERQRRRLWSKTVDASQVRGTALLRITAYHPSETEARKIVAAVAFLLSSQGGEYVGRDINVRLVDPPLASRFPVQPNLLLQALAGVAVGAVLGSGWVWMGHRKRKHHGELL